MKYLYNLGNSFTALDSSYLERKGRPEQSQGLWEFFNSVSRCFTYSRFSVCLLLSICLLSFLLFPCASAADNTRAWVSYFRIAILSHTEWHLHFRTVKLMRIWKLTSISPGLCKSFHLQKITIVIFTRTIKYFLRKKIEPVWKNFIISQGSFEKPLLTRVCKVFHYQLLAVVLLK